MSGANEERYDGEEEEEREGFRRFRVGEGGGQGNGRRFGDEDDADVNKPARGHALDASLEYPERDTVPRV